MGADQRKRRTMNEDTERAAIAAAQQARPRCICLEQEGAPACEHPAPITREQIGRLRAYASLHPERAVIYSKPAGEWLAALRAFLPQDENPILSWFLDPFGLPPEADLHHAGDLGTLLDLLGAPPTPELS